MTTTRTPTRTSPRTGLGAWPLTAIGAGLAAIAVSAMAMGLVVAGGSYTEALPGLPDPGPLVGWGSSILRLLTDLAAVLTVGWLLAAAFLDPSGKDGVVSPLGRRDLRRAAAASVAWAVLAIVQLFFELANVLGLPLSDALDPSVVSTYANEVASTRALLVMAVLAAVVCVGVLFTATTGATAAWLVVALVSASLPALAGHAAGLGDHALALTAGVAHVISAVVWVGGLAALALHAARREGSMARSASRFSTIALIAIMLLAASGMANAYTRLDNIGQLFTTGYGQVTLVKALLIVGLAILGWVMRTRVISTLHRSSRIGAFARVAGIELVIMATAIGLGVALAASPPPRVEVPLGSYGESLLGYAYPPPPTILTVGLGFNLDPLFFTASLIAAGLYLAGVIRLHRRGDRWPVMRTVSWLAGLAVVIWCTNAGIALYSQVSVGLHMVMHMTLTMLAPIFLVLGAPATLALRALNPAKGNERGPREWLVWFLHSWITRLLTNPLYVFFVYVIGLYGLYFTPLFGWLMGSHVGHVIMQVHFIVSGYLFYWILIGIDPRPKPLPYWGRMVLLLLALSLHGFFAVAMMMGTTPIATDWYGVVQPPWITDPLRDTLDAGQVAWGLSEIPSLIVLIAIAVQWSRSDEREATRLDRQADRDDDAELRAYNERLAALAQRGQSRPS
ncbi:MAG: copper resistance protein CopD [Actinomycetales bacterium]|nr:copper resistance protein CopD [Actinomycetales bacterium]